ncbi:glycoside hydrolase superfamily [Exophiala viscosa]|nr:glycoside hydrolase superfamily [Exophiala viscosa]
MYLTGQHNHVPDLSLVKDITHVILAFMRSEVFNQEEPQEWPLFTTVNAVRAQFAPGTSIMIAIGGWGDTVGFPAAAADASARKRFARNVRTMVDATGADGVDIDWEYPGGNGEDYKIVPNAEKDWEVDAFPKLLAEIRSALGATKVISAAVPGLPRDMIAFTHGAVPKIDASLDFWNVMTYDLMNRRDNVTKHHAGISASLASVDAYLERGVPSGKVNIGLAFYVKWFRTGPTSECTEKLIGCPTLLLEDPDTGADLGRAGAFCWVDEVPSDLTASFAKAMDNGRYDFNGGGQYYYDSEEHIFWSWESTESVARKATALVRTRKIGGVFAWGLGEDSKDWSHLKTLTAAYQVLGSPSRSGHESLRKDEL